jgi:putative ABC transport system permease protein
MLNLFRFVGLRHLRMKPVRTILTALGVSFGVALYIAIEIINRSTLTSFRESIDAVAGKATLSVSAGDAGFPEGLLDKISHTAGVKHTAPMIETRAYFAGDKSNDSLMVFGVDLLKEQSVRTYKTTDEQVIADPLVFLNQPDSIILTHTFAEAHHLQMDSKFTLATARGSKTFTVRGLLSPEGPAKAYGGGMALMDIDGAQLTFGKEGKFDRVDVVTEKDADVDKVATAIEGALGHGFTVERPETQSQNMERMVKTYQAMLTLFSTLALLVGVFLVTNSISIAVAERRREIGTLRALGASRKGILALFLSEALAMGAVGSLAGVWFGRKLAQVMVGMVTFSMEGQFLMKMETPVLQFKSSDFGQAVWIGAIVALIAASWPSLRATLIQPLDAMRKHEGSIPRSAFNIMRHAPMIGAAMLIYYAISVTTQFTAGLRIAGWLDQGAAMIGAALVGPTIVVALVRLTAPFAIPLGGPVTRLADDNLLRNPQRTGSNVISLMVGLILVIMIATVNVSSKNTILDWFGRMFQSDLVVSSAGKVISFETQPLREDIGRELSEVPGVRRGPERGAYGMRFVHLKYGDKQLGVKAYDDPDPVFNYSSLVSIDRDPVSAGRDLFHSADPTVMISRNFVLNFHNKTGDHLELDTPTGRVSFRIVGVMEDYASPVGVLYMNRVMYKKFWQDPLVNVFSISIEKGASLEAVRKEIDHRFGMTKNLTTTSTREFHKEMSDIVDQTFAYTDAIKLAALLVGLLGLFNTFLISVMERTRELGMLRAVGMSRSQMRKMVLTEALIQGSFGAVAAALLGTAISYLWIQGTFAKVLGWIVSFHFPWWGVVSTIFTGVVVALLAGIFPAYRASHLEIREALEYE